MSWFDLNEIDESIEKNEHAERDHLIQVKFNELVCQHASNFKSISDFKLEEGVQLRIVTTKPFNAITFLQLVGENYELDEIVIAVYRMNINSVNFVKEYIETKNVRISLLLSNFFRENKKYEKWTRELVSYAAGNEMIKVAFARSHAKIALLKTKCNKSIVMEGSGNLSDNARIEQYVIDVNDKLYQFHKNWIFEQINEYYEKT